jgi:hypothetical protein
VNNLAVSERPCCYFQVKTAYGWRGHTTASYVPRLRELKPGADIHYVFMDWRHLPELLATGRALYTEWKNLLVWNKTNAGLGAFYRSKHELIAVFKTGRAPHINNFGMGAKGRYRTNVLDYLRGLSFDI